MLTESVLKNHFINIVEPEDEEAYKGIIDSVYKYYNEPPGCSTIIGITSIWEFTPIRKEKQIYGAQGSDTINCCVPVQSVAYFSSLIPKIIRKIKYNLLISDDVVKNYLSIYSYGNVDYVPDNFRDIIYNLKGGIQRISLAGLYIVHTPADGDALSLPAINKNMIYSNPFYDVDVVEFFISIPLRYRIKLSPTKSIKRIIYLDKIILRKLAEKYLDKNVVHRKKGFTIPIYKNPYIMNLLNSEKPFYDDIKMVDLESKFRNFMFRLFVKDKSIKISI